jgi:hypothetical protein
MELIGDPNAGKYIQGNLSAWYNTHPEIKVGSSKNNSYKTL